MVNNALNELKENNYLEIEKGYDYDGKFIYEYIIYEIARRIINY